MIKKTLTKNKFIFKSGSMASFSTNCYDAYTPKLALHKILNAMIRKGNPNDQSMFIIKNKHTGKNYEYFVVIEKLETPIKRQIGSVTILQKYKKIIVKK